MIHSGRPLRRLLQLAIGACRPLLSLCAELTVSKLVMQYYVILGMYLLRKSRSAADCIQACHIVLNLRGFFRSSVSLPTNDSYVVSVPLAAAIIA